jgi:hypothetical protein
MVVLSGFGLALATFSWVYWTVAGVTVVLAWYWSRGRKSKILWSAVAASIVLFLPGLRVYRTVKYQLRYTEAKALFDERCKRAGERIAKTVVNVEGVFLLRLRPRELNLNRQYELDDPYGRDFGGDGYLISYLMGRQPNGTHTELHTRGGFKFVETTDGETGRVKRWTPVLTPRALDKFHYIKLEGVVVPARLARYGITWSDLSTKEDRDHWIAGSSLRVIDIETNTVVAERIGYMFDPGLGDKSGGRSPWTYAAYNACPAFDKSVAGTPIRTTRSLDFVHRVLEPSRGD